MKFHYSARTKSGEMQVGFVEGANKNAALNILNSHDLFLLSIEEIKTEGIVASLTGFFRRIKRVDLMIFTRQFATMLEAKISLNDSLKNLYAQTKNVFLRDVIFEVLQDIDSGLALSQALERQPHVFSDFYVNLIKSAEVTGRLEEVMVFLADFLEKELTLVTKVRNALIYPIFVLVLFVVVAGILIGFVFPQLTPIFKESRVPLPGITRWLLASGSFIASWWLVLLIIFGALAAMLIDYSRSEEGKAFFNALSLKLPVIGPLFTKVYVTRFSESISVLIKGGIPVAQAIEISGHAIGSPLYGEALHDVADAVRRGDLLSVALSSQPNYFPPMVSQMTAIGEKTGKLEEMFGRVAQFYTREIDGVVNNLVELIQPALMVFLGVMVGLLFAAILIPIYNLAQAF